MGIIQMDCVIDQLCKIVFVSHTHTHVHLHVQTQKHADRENTHILLMLVKSYS